MKTVKSTSFVKTALLVLCGSAALVAQYTGAAGKGMNAKPDDTLTISAS